MVLRGLDFRIASGGGASPMSQHPLDLTFLERRSIDLNKHALDLNEAPLNLNCMAMHSAGAPLGMEAHNLAIMSDLGLYDSPAMSMWPTKNGGWLELFRDMFEPGKNIKSPGSYFPSILGESGHNATSRSSEQIFDRFSGIEKRSRSFEQTFPCLSEQLNKRPRVCEQPLYRIFEDPENSKPSQATVFPCIPEQIQNRNVGQTFFRSHDAHKLLNSRQQTFQSISSLETPRNSFDEGKISKDVLSLFRQQEKCKSSLEQSFHCIPSHMKMNKNLEQTYPRIPKQEDEGFTKVIEQRTNWMLKEQKSDNKTFKQIGNGISEDHSSSGCQQPLPHYLLHENCPSNGGGTFQVRVQEKGGTICRGNLLDLSKAQSFSANAVKVQTPVVQIIESPDWVPADWVTELKTRQTGNTAGTKDKYYKDPASGHRFRSKNEVMTYLQTGRMSRYKPKVKCLESANPIMITSHFMPKQDKRLDLHSSIQLNPFDLAGGLTLPRLDSTPGLGTSCLERSNSSVLGRSPDCVNDVVPKLSAWQSTGPHNLISVNIAVKEENEVLSGGLGGSCCVTKGLDAPTSVEGVCVETRTELNSEKKIKKEEGLRLLGCTIMGTNQQSAGKVQQSKMQVPSIASAELPFEQSLPGVKKLVTEEDLNIWTESIDMALQKAEAPPLCVRIEANLRITHIIDALIPYETVAMPNTLQLANLSLPSGSLGEMHSGKWPFNDKVCVGKVAKLTARQGRELLVVMGRKLCQQFLGSVM